MSQAGPANAILMAITMSDTITTTRTAIHTHIGLSVWH